MRYTIIHKTLTDDFLGMSIIDADNATEARAKLSASRNETRRDPVMVLAVLRGECPAEQFNFRMTAEGYTA